MRAQHMEIFIADQIKTMAESCLLGLIFGVGYDIIRIAYILGHVATYRGTCEKPVPHTKGAFALFFGLDFSYLLVVTFFFSVFLFHANHGIFRLYLFLPAVLGFFIYYRTIGRLVMFFSETIVLFLRRLAEYLLWKPICFLGSRLWRLGKYLWNHSVGVIVRQVGRQRRIRYARNLEKKFADWVRL